MHPGLFEYVVCPACKGSLKSAGEQILCPHCNFFYEILNGIPIMLAQDSHYDKIKGVAAKYEKMHADHPDPWHYRRRAAEILKRRWILHQISLHRPEAARILDIGCSSGYLSSELGNVCSCVFSIDVASSAVSRARSTCSGFVPSRHSGHTFFVGSANALPFASNLFDAVVVSDGLSEWNMGAELERQTLAECQRVLTDGGITVFTDYVRPERFDEWIDLIHSGPSRILSVDYLYDRLWYQFESLFHMIDGLRVVESAVRSVALARFLMGVGRVFGRKGSKHILIVTQK